MKAEIISCGTELLLGHIVDTNAAWLAQQLAPLGIDVYYVSQVGDNQGRVVGLLKTAWKRSDLIIMTGGIGPTEDDATRESIAELVGEKMKVDPQLEAELRAFWTRRGRPMPERNVKQANLIPSASSLPNPHGTAPGWFVEKNGRVIVAMPGVPHEMYRMWKDEAEPRIVARLGAGVIHTRIHKVLGIGESQVEEMIDELIHGTNPTVATYAKADGIYVRVSAKADSVDAAEAMMAPIEARLREILGEHVYATDEDTLVTVLAHLLRERAQKLAVMEFNTGGLIASQITDGPGAAEWFAGALIPYSAARLKQFGVDAAVVDQHGAASLETARAMASAARRELNADVGLAVTGTTGAEGTSRQHPGSLYLAVDVGGEVVAEEGGIFGTTAPQLKQRAALAALDFLRKRLQRVGAAVSSPVSS
jgi:nicotinamide-nucleotide amidase